MIKNYKKKANLATEDQKRLKSKRLHKTISEGPKIFHEIGLKDSVQKGCSSMIRFRFFNELDNNISNKMIEKLEPYSTTSCYFIYLLIVHKILKIKILFSIKKTF